MFHESVTRDMLMIHATLKNTRNKIWMNQVDWGMWFYKRGNLQSYKYRNNIDLRIFDINIILWFLDIRYT